MKSAAIKVMIVDDHQMFVDGIDSLLDNVGGIELIDKAFSGKELMGKLKRERPDVLLMDVNLPDITGVDLSKKIKDLYPDLQILALTMYNIRKYVYNMLEIGVSGYIIKNTGKDELVNAIRSVASGASYYSQEVKDLFFTCHSKQNEHPLPKLTPREKEILKNIANEYTTPEIAEALFLTVDTIETHRKNIIQKLNVRNTAGMIKVALENNLVDT
jgi:DNA-binding NarL/FixJ family response regulator